MLTRFVKTLLLAVTALCVALPSAWAEEILGTVKVWIDGDVCLFAPATGGEDILVRLWLVDAPEIDQPMGQNAARYVKDHPEVGEGKRVYLDKITMDKYKRTIGQLRGETAEKYCTEDLLSSGYFWLYYPAMRNRPKEAEVLKAVFDATKSAKKGIFKYESSVAPWDWRKMNKDTKQKAREAFELERHRKG